MDPDDLPECVICGEEIIGKWWLTSAYETVCELCVDEADEQGLMV